MLTIVFQLELLGSDGALGSRLKGEWSLVGHREDNGARKDPFYQEG